MLASCEKNLASLPPIPWQEQNVLEDHSSNNTVTSIDFSTNGITRRNFMKKTALSVGAVTLLGQGIGLAAGSSGGGLRWLHVSDKRTSPVRRTVTVPYQDPDDIPALYAEALWGMLGNNTEQHEIGRLRSMSPQMK